MRELILLRHAHADAAAPGQDDADRPLSATGRDEARAAGDWLREHGLRPDRVLCSPARRTRETLEELGDIGGPPATVEASIYAAEPGTLAALADANRDAERLLLVGHNPGLERLAALMHSGQSGDYRGMPPAGIAVLRLPVDAAIEPGVAALTRFWWP
jgi:phosphohistidine phosphatase SixA